MLGHRPAVPISPWSVQEPAGCRGDRGRRYLAVRSRAVGAGVGFRIPLSSLRSVPRLAGSKTRMVLSSARHSRSKAPIWKTANGQFHGRSCLCMRAPRPGSFAVEPHAAPVAGRLIRTVGLPRLCRIRCCCERRRFGFGPAHCRSVCERSAAGPATCWPPARSRHGAGTWTFVRHPTWPADARGEGPGPGLPDATRSRRRPGADRAVGWPRCFGRPPPAPAAPRPGGRLPCGLAACPGMRHHSGRRLARCTRIVRAGQKITARFRLACANSRRRYCGPCCFSPEVC